MTDYTKIYNDEINKIACESLKMYIDKHGKDIQEYVSLRSKINLGGTAYGVKDVMKVVQGDSVNTDPDDWPAQVRYLKDVCDKAGHPCDEEKIINDIEQTLSKIIFYEAQKIDEAFKN